MRTQEQVRDCKVAKVACFQLWEQEVGGSNPPAPTILSWGAVNGPAPQAPVAPAQVNWAYARLRAHVDRPRPPDPRRFGPSKLGLRSAPGAR